MKKALSLLLAGSMVFSLAACGGSKDTAGTTTDSTAASSDAAGSDTFKIGATGPITGGAAIYGNAVKNGIQIAVDEINEAGGIGGYQIDYNFQDDEHDAEKAVNAYNNLKDWGMQVLIGTTTSAPCIAVVEKTHADNMFQITPSGTAVECVQYDNAYRMCFSDPTQGTESAKYIGENGMAQKVAVIYDSSDVYSTGIYEAFAAEAANQPFEIVSVEAFTADAKTDFSVQVQKSKDAGADLLFMPFYYTEASLVLAAVSYTHLNRPPQSEAVRDARRAGEPVFFQGEEAVPGDGAVPVYQHRALCVGQFLFHLSEKESVRCEGGAGI